MDDPRAAVHSLIRRNNGADKMVFGKPAKAAARHIAKAMRPEEAFRATLSDCLSQITANAATLRLGRSVEGLHQLRVAFRRLEVRVIVQVVLLHSPQQWPPVLLINGI